MITILHLQRNEKLQVPQNQFHYLLKIVPTAVMNDSLKHQEDFGGHRDKILKHCFIFQKAMTIQLQVTVSTLYVLDENLMVHGCITYKQRNQEL